MEGSIGKAAAAGTERLEILSTEAATGKGEASRKDVARCRLACVHSIHKTKSVSATVAGQEKWSQMAGFSLNNAH